MLFEWVAWVDLRNHVLDGVYGEAAILGVVQPIEKYHKSLLRCMQHKTSNGIITTAAANSLFPTGWCHNDLFPA